jgi:hypothetical protein
MIDRSADQENGGNIMNLIAFLLAVLVGALGGAIAAGIADRMSRPGTSNRGLATIAAISAFLVLAIITYALTKDISLESATQKTAQAASYIATPIKDIFTTPEGAYFKHNPDGSYVPYTLTRADRIYLGLPEMGGGDGNEATATPGTSDETVPYTVTPVPVLETPVTGNNSPAAPQTCSFAAPGNLDDMPKMVIEDASANTWFHRVFKPALFKAPNWDGADNWFVSLALGPNSGGVWTSHKNSGEIVYRGTDTHLMWCLGVLTTAKWKSQFLEGANYAAAINVRIAPHSVVAVTTHSGKTLSQATSDMGDITIILPDSGVTVVSVSYSTAAPTHESLVWWGPYDRSENINTVDAR